MGFVLSLPEETILDEISKKEFKRKDIAETYHLVMVAEQFGKKVDWNKINKAIIGRWSLSGLKYIKKYAWGYKV